MRRLEFIGERILTGSAIEFSDLPPLFGPFEPLLSSLVHVRAPRWRDLKKPLCAFIVLGKDRPHAG